MLDIKDQQLNNIKQDKNRSLMEIQFLRGENKKLSLAISSLREEVKTLESISEQKSKIDESEDSEEPKSMASKSCPSSLKELVPLNN
jgi:hypothetical protein